MLGRLLLLGASLLLCLALTEVTLRATTQYPPQPSAYIPDFELGKRLAPGFQGKHHGAWISINRHGMRDREHPLERPAGTLRILALGDSWTFGVAVAQDQTWPKQLEAALAEGASRGGPAGGAPRYEVMNTGVSGYETYNEALYYERDLARFEHDLVLVGMYPVNDVDAKHETYAQRRRLHALSPLLYSASRLPRRLMIVQYYEYWREQRKQQRRAAHYGATTRLAGEHHVDPDGGFAPGELDWTQLYSDDYSGWRMLKRSLASIGRGARANGVRGAVLLFPDLRDLARYARYCHPKVEPLIARAVEDAGLVLIDLLPDFAAWQGREGEIALKGRAGSTHPNARGYALIGRAVARELEERGLLPSAPAGVPSATRAGAARQSVASPARGTS